MTRPWLVLGILTCSIPASPSCTLDPKGVGNDRDTAGETTGEPPADDGSADDSAIDESGGLDGASETTASPPDGPSDGSGDLVYEWTGRIMWQAILTPFDELLVFSTSTDTEHAFIDTFSADGTEHLASQVLDGRPYAFATIGQRIALGGGSAAPEDPEQNEAFLWILDAGEFIHTSVLAGPHSFIRGLASDGEGWWTLTYQDEGMDPSLTMLRRHALGGEIETTVEFSHGSRLAVGTEGWAYVANASPWTLHRISPDGAVAWSVPMDEQPLLEYILSSWSEPGVAVVAQHGAERHIQLYDATGQIAHEFTVPAPDMVPGPSLPGPPAEVTDTIVMTHTHATDGYRVERWSLDGTLLWHVERTVPGIEIMPIQDTIHHPHGAVVLGQQLMGGADMLGFMHVVQAP